MSLPSGHYHLAGVAGVGMSALAQVLRARGCRVSGSDRFLDQGREMEVLRQLAAGGVELVRQDGSGLNPATAALVYSTAVEEDNPEIKTARRLGVPIVHRAAMLAELARGRRVLAVTGTSGKTTVCGMLGWIAESLGLDPTVVNGGAVAQWMGPARIGNVRVGTSDLWIVEADESDRSLMQFEPHGALINNISKDHFELAEVQALFTRFARQVREICVGGPGVGEVVRRGEGLRARWVDVPHVSPKGPGRFAFRGQDVVIRLPGAHNIANAAAALTMGEALGWEFRGMCDALASFRGIQRRLEPVGAADGVAVLDDYAHNPAKIRAAWDAVAETAPRILAVWRPHGFGPLAAMLPELRAAFRAVCRPQDTLYILPVFYAGGTASQTVSSTLLVRQLSADGVSTADVDGYPALLDRLARDARAGDVVLFMGARDPDLPVMARQLLERLAQRRDAHHATG